MTVSNHSSSAQTETTRTRTIPCAARQTVVNLVANEVIEDNRAMELAQENAVILALDVVSLEVHEIKEEMGEPSRRDRNA